MRRTQPKFQPGKGSSVLPLSDLQENITVREHEQADDAAWGLGSLPGLPETSVYFLFTHWDLDSGNGFYILLGHFYFNANF